MTQSKAPSVGGALPGQAPMFAPIQEGLEQGATEVPVLALRRGVSSMALMPAKQASGCVAGYGMAGWCSLACELASCGVGAVRTAWVCGSGKTHMNVGSASGYC